MKPLKLILLIIFQSLLVAPSLAGGCSGCPVPCGRVENKTDKKMLFTTNPNPNLDANVGRCRFWNWYETFPWDTENRLVSCTQKPLAANTNKGGCSSKIDVDGYTFPSNDYWVNGIKKTKGVWTKIANTQTTTCHKYTNGQLHCS